jgi:hypothetical protein
MYNTIKNRTTSLIAALPHSGNRIAVLNSNGVLSLDIILGITIIISILGHNEGQSLNRTKTKIQIH